ncbi:Pnap_2097 family protein [Methylibium petroleiphilum]|uniref:Pnap_2097 family protein n=1 Tax=Methylibium petroleiphilum TaxID=105560 RepID=UPI003D2CAFC3
MTAATPPLALQSGRFVAGMPQLCPTGLSENWLLKECGHQHWLALARRQGRARPDFRDAGGRKAYAAFTAVRIRHARLDRVAENDRLRVVSRCLPVGRSQHFGLHELRGRDGTHAQVEMLSTFVRRERAGDNRSVVRAAVPATATAPEADVERAALAACALQLAERGRALRSGQWQPDFGPASERGAPLREFRFQPCPLNDFNGADLLYFASFQAIVDRAEGAWFGSTALPRLAERELAFYGNVNVGESLTVLLRGVQESPDGLSHWCELRRTGDGARLADVLTRKRRAPVAGTGLSA